MKIKGDMQDTQEITLRNQIKDVLKYLRKTDRYCLERQNEEVVLDNLCTNAGLVDLSSLMQEYGNGDSSKVFIRGYSAEDYDGYPEGFIEISTERKQTDGRRTFHRRGHQEADRTGGGFTQELRVLRVPGRGHRDLHQPRPEVADGNHRG